MALSNKLTKADVQAVLRQRVDKPKIVSDGKGLYLRLRPDGTASWLFAATVGGRRRELGLGNAETVKLQTARDLADDIRQAITKGRDPFAERAATKRELKDAVKVPTFGDFADDYIASVESGWKNQKHRQQWKNSLREHAAGIWKTRIDEVGTDDVLDVLRPIWTSKPETASRVRGRIEKILSAAKVRSFRARDSFNPATWRGHLDLLLPRQPQLSRGHHAALPFEDAPAFMAKLRTRPATAARALEFTILTAARTGESIGAKWREVDLDAKVWTVPADRMKAGVEHRVPLSSAAVALLKALRPEEVQPDALIFGSLSNMAMAMLLRRLDVDVTVHGFRSTFRDWAGESPVGYPRELAEQALAHTISNKAEAAYRRQTAVERRRPLMEDWATYLANSSVEEQLIAA